ncbi:hypothetical protein D4S03_08580 [bacterium]|nr:MAG: hypothetical protein D4S03_08580 [bacterium]
MYDYSGRIESFRDQKVRLSADLLYKLLAHRKANRDRLISRLPEEIPGLTIGESSFKSQGSVAMQTVIQTIFTDEEYDIDDGVVLWKHQLVKKDGAALTAAEAKEKVRGALKDPRFNRQPRICTNCVRVFYADTDEEKHHVDFPVYRKWEGDNGKTQRELAGEDTWIESDPTQVNVWFDGKVELRNKTVDGWGTQFRQLIQLLKRFCRSRTDWDMPNGMKLTMLVVECQPGFHTRIDIAFRELINNLEGRLQYSKTIRNLAHPEKPTITRTESDRNVIELQNRCKEAVDKLGELDKPSNDNPESVRILWDWIFKSDGFFKEFDEKRKEEEKKKDLMNKATLIGLGAKTSGSGIIGTSGISNLPHKFYGDKTQE